MSNGWQFVTNHLLLIRKSYTQRMLPPHDGYRLMVVIYYLYVRVRRENDIVVRMTCVTKNWWEIVGKLTKSLGLDVVGLGDCLIMMYKDIRQWMKSKEIHTRKPIVHYVFMLASCFSLIDSWWVVLFLMSFAVTICLYRRAWGSQSLRVFVREFLTQLILVTPERFEQNMHRFLLDLECSS